MLDRADRAGRDQFMRPVREAFEVPAIGDDDFAPGRVRRRDDVAGIGRGSRKRLLDEDMQSLGQRSQRMLVMIDMRRGDDHTVHRDGVQHRAIILERGGHAEFAGHGRKLLGTEPVDRDDLAIRIGLQQRQMVGDRPPAGPDHADTRLPRHVSHSSRFAACAVYSFARAIASSVERCTFVMCTSIALPAASSSRASSAATIT